MSLLHVPKNLDKAPRNIRHIKDANRVKIRITCILYVQKYGNYSGAIRSVWLFLMHGWSWQRKRPRIHYWIFVVHFPALVMVTTSCCMFKHLEMYYLSQPSYLGGELLSLLLWFFKTHFRRSMLTCQTDSVSVVKVFPCRRCPRDSWLDCDIEANFFRLPEWIFKTDLFHSLLAYFKKL